MSCCMSLLCLLYSKNVNSLSFFYVLQSFPMEKKLCTFCPILDYLTNQPIQFWLNTVSNELVGIEIHSVDGIFCRWFIGTVWISCHCHTNKNQQAFVVGASGN